MVTIEVQSMRLQAFHGLYKGEPTTGSPYDVSVKVMYEEGHESFETLKDTISYVEIVDIVKKRMSVPAPLLETVADGIIREIKHQYPFTREIMVSVYKLDAPIENFQGKIGVIIHKCFNE
jgi:7,8-dihydroneopterin aldolase/epimerase/oxygenase